MEIKRLHDFILRSLEEDIGDGDHTSLASISTESKGKARMLVKENCILAGVEVSKEVFLTIDPELTIELLMTDGQKARTGDIVLYVSGYRQSILKAERLVLNIIQRMSGIATNTNLYVSKLEGLNTKILDTRKTTPGFRFLEKEAVRIGGGMNHRMGLFDMIMLKDNHIEYAGGVVNAINSVQEYLKKTGRKLKIEIEARNLNDVETILKTGGVDRIMLDNFTPENTCKAVKMIAKRFETESSGGITLDTVRNYAECGVDFISVGALTHHFKSVDISLKAM